VSGQAVAPSRHPRRVANARKTVFCLRADPPVDQGGGSV